MSYLNPTVSEMRSMSLAYSKGAAVHGEAWSSRVEHAGRVLAQAAEAFGLDLSDPLALEDHLRSTWITMEISVAGTQQDCMNPDDPIHHQLLGLHYTFAAVEALGVLPPVEPADPKDVSASIRDELVEKAYGRILGDGATDEALRELLSGPVTDTDPGPGPEVA